jgi:hypothetical protein
MLSALSAPGAVYYVATNGFEANVGTSLESPFRTLSHAARIMVAGDTCLIRAGIYREKLRPEHSGTSAAPITFEAYSNEVVTIAATEPVTDWTYVSPGLYKAAVAWDIGNGYNQVFIDGEMIHQGRYPSFGAGGLLNPSTVSVTVNGNTITSSAFDGRAQNFWAGAWFSGGAGYQWSWQCARIVASSGNSITLDVGTESNPWFTGSGTGFIWGLSALMDSDNEWHLDSANKTLLLRVHRGDNPAKQLIEMKRRNWCVDVDGCNFIIIRGLQLRGGAVRLRGNGNLLENCRARFLSHFLTYAWGYAYDGGIQPGGGVVLDGVNNTVRGCTISDTAGSGIISSGGGNSIARNFIYNTDYSGTYACAIRLNGWKDQVCFNTAFRSGRDILQPGGAGHAISFNDFSYPGQLCKDLGVIYAWGVNAQTTDHVRTRITYNWIHDNVSTGPTPLIYLDNWSRNFVVDHNVCFNNTGDSGIRVNGPAANHQLYNNTLFNCDAIGTHTYNMWPANNPDPAFWKGNLYQYAALNNLYLGSSPAGQLADWTHYDFRLRKNAAAINAGVAVPGYTDSLGAHSTPAQGAYDSTGLTWKAGVNGWVQPSLSVARRDPMSLTLTAPPGAAYFQLMMTTNASRVAVWIPVTNAPSISYTQWSITLPNVPGEPRFYRLQAR